MKRAKQFNLSGSKANGSAKAEADRWRGSAADRGYDHKWRKARSRFLRDNPLCIGCLAIGRTEPATVVDHVDPHKGDDAKFWNDRMWQACCRWHHDAVKQRLEQMHAAGSVGLDALWLNSRVAVEVASRMACIEVTHPPVKSPEAQTP